MSEVFIRVFRNLPGAEEEEKHDKEALDFFTQSWRYNVLQWCFDQRWTTSFVHKVEGCEVDFM